MRNITLYAPEAIAQVYALNILILFITGVGSMSNLVLLFISYRVSPGQYKPPSCHLAITEMLMSSLAFVYDLHVGQFISLPPQVGGRNFQIV